ncbi:hypothetical protein OCA5_c18890 [Afipia carboxidovorans OM5]|uniref:Uncharacterized protein n=1 Tax=Afipia carboxidovorans (strain ATCC 49405 / DSM 1227 / KCTC 32145 / OM5) TaxID=504832 RepID=F8BUE9_AFIC5|nr:hypothetical protein [Afipia carboxidovorans]AEI03025.1 hypothetical protein OCA4_c18880 [Afipia carboxidovorans OM4]AEI06602.1 hypothetical protein OCA5_c18890 [Afipia carboxidovorans OM5]
MQIAFVTFNADPKHSKAVRNAIENASTLASSDSGYSVSVLHHVPLKNNRDPNLRYVRLGQPTGSFTSRYRHFINEVDQRASAKCFNVVYAIVPVLRCGLYEPYDGLVQEVSGLPKFLSLIGGPFNRRRQLLAEVEREMLAQQEPPFIVCHNIRMACRIKSTFNFDRIAVIPRANRKR